MYKTDCNCTRVDYNMQIVTHLKQQKSSTVIVLGFLYRVYVLFSFLHMCCISCIFNKSNSCDFH